MTHLFRPLVEGARTHKCFGFVRFRNRFIAKKAIDVMNGSILHGQKLVVKLATFGWKQRWNYAETKYWNTKQEQLDGPQAPLIVKGSKADEISKTASVQTTTMARKDLSFAAVTTRSEKKGEESIEVSKETICANSNWLSNSMVAKLKWKGTIPNIQGLCEAGGLNNVEVAQLGGEMLLLSFSNLEEALPKLESL